MLRLIIGISLAGASIFGLCKLQELGVPVIINYIIAMIIGVLIVDLIAAIGTVKKKRKKRK